MAKKSAPQKMFAILETHFEYDDNYYNATDGYSKPLAIYKSEENAQKACDIRNEDFIMSSQFAAYLSDGMDSFLLKEGIEYMRQFQNLIAPLEVHNEEEESMDVNFETIHKDWDWDASMRFVRYFQAVYRLLPEGDERRSKMIGLVQTVPYSVHEVLVES